MKLASADLQLGQALSLVSIQAHCSRAEAMFLLRHRAAQRDEPLADVAVAVVTHRIRFDPLPLSGAAPAGAAGREW